MDIYGSDSLAAAERVVAGFLDGDFGVGDFPAGVALADLEADAQDFAVELRLLGDRVGRAPAVRIGGEEPVPLALSVVVDPPWDPTESRLSEWLGTSAFDAWGDDVSRVLGEGLQDNDVELLPLDVVVQGFRRSATRFLARRIHALVDLLPEAWATAEVFAPMRLGHAPTPVPGCQFSVTTNSHGLRVVYSGAYRRSKGAFGAPTTPVRGALQSGDYQFGVDGGPYGQRGRWDNAIVTLPGPATVHLHF